MLTLKDYISKLDTERFGFNIAKVDFDEKNNSIEIILFLKQQKTPLIITKVNCENIFLINQLEKHGFRIMDFQLGYDYYGTTEKLNELKNKNTFPIREISSQDVDQVVILAKNLFKGFGHYFADTRLDREKCLEIYKDWTRNCCTKKEFADVVYAAYDQKKPIGFFGFKEKKINNAPMATGSIVAVSSDYSGKGILQSLLIRGIEWAASKNLVLTDMRMHPSNYAINSAFSKLGFRIKKSYVTMHCWYDETI
ncbi:MAG: GNAT family N-acetyltransferase [Bacteroidota bacterium]